MLIEKDIKKNENCIKILLLGDSKVGKSSLLFKYSDGTFSDSYLSTQGIDMKTKKIDGINLNMQLWDTSGKERFRTLTSSYYNKAKGILVVFDITNLDSFGNVRKWIQDIKRYAMEDVSLILIGNKSDLVKERRVSFQDGKEFAEEYGIKYIETSAKSSEGLDNAFNCLARMIIESKSNQDLKDMDLEVDIKDSNDKDLSSSSQNHDENKFPEMDNASFDELMQYKLIDLKKCCKKKGP